MRLLKLLAHVSVPAVEPSREIIHSHDFNRYLTPFRAEWDPKDPLEHFVVIGRCKQSPAVAYHTFAC